MSLKKLLFLLLAIPFFSFSQSSDDKSIIYLNVDGKEINNQEFRLAWSKHARWDYINEEGNRVNTLHDTVFLMYDVNYEIFKNKLETVINRKIPSNATILIEYNFANDLCSSSIPDNRWSKSRIRERKRFINRYVKKAKKNANIFIVFLFENAIKLDSNPDKESEYFFSDKNDYFRNNYFIKPTACGSFGAIKPNGDFLIQNGENRIDLFAESLNDENWSSFFPEEH